jgi:hypothetical protein
LYIAEKGPGAWDQDLSTQLAAKLLMIDSNAGQLPHPDRYNIRDLAYFYFRVVDPDSYVLGPFISGFVIICPDPDRSIKTQKEPLFQLLMNLIFIGILSATDEKSRIGGGSGSRWCGSRDPNRYQNVTDPLYWSNCFALF